MSPRSNIRPHISLKQKKNIRWVGALGMAQKGATISIRGKTTRANVRVKTKYA
jgi:hypothetical protein